MQGKYFLCIFCLIVLFVAPAASTLNKIAPGSPVFVGENDVDISSALNGCHTIAWWPNGTSISIPAAKNVTIYESNSVSETIFHYNITPELYSGYTGTWYCEDKSPMYPVFSLRDPQMTLKIWDLDHDKDVTGKTIPRATNITYRIDTNLFPVLNYFNRPNTNPTDGFFTVRLTDPLNRNVANIYTGSYGGAKTLILPFDTNPYVSSSPYLWKNGNTWDHAARNIQGDMIYPPGTYTFTASQSLNHMYESYASGGTGADGKTTSTAIVTLLGPEPLGVQSSLVPVVSSTPGIISTTQPATPTTYQVISTLTPIPNKTTYTPMPGWIALLGLGISAFAMFVRRNK